MRRRVFLGVLGGAAAAWPLTARAQQVARPIVAFIHPGTANTLASYAGAFRKGLSEVGFAESQNVQVEYHWLEGHSERLPALLSDLTRRRVAVIATPGATEIALAVVAANSTIPIVFGVGGDPVGLGLVSSLARPSGNATGINFLSLEVDTKRLALMHELLPKAHRFAVLVNPADAPSTDAASKATKDAASGLGLDLVFFKASSVDEINVAFAAFAGEKVDALFIAGDGFFASRAVQLATLAVRERVPASFPTRPMVEAGLLMSYGTDIIDSFRQVGIYTGAILKGAKPSDLPVLQSTKYQFVINLQAAKSLGVDISPMLLARADEVIE